ncbi:FecCD family ABC transporter permease [Thalassobaculum sp.]|uniref:FecCD family ABC transporter permease n=1 Tax=Thalassobaculum sp. TaxID=2022740 RepID=UPI003B59DF94
MTADASPSLAYGQLTRRRQLLLAGLAAALLASVAADLSFGPVGLDLGDILTALLAPGEVDPRTRVVLWQIRLPGALMAVLVGAALALAGGVMQTILNNPLASPFTLGLSAAAGFGAALSLAFGIALVPLAAFVVPVNAFLMAMATALVIHLLSLRRGVTAETIVLFGIALVFTFNALLALVQYFASDRAVSAIVFWTLGNLTKASWESLGITAAAIVLAVPVLVRQVWALTALRLGDDKAASFGIRVGRVRLLSLLAVSLLAAVPVAFVGTIGFIGIVGPHIARMLVGEDQRYFLPTSSLCGALILSLSAIVSKALIPGTIFPIGVVTALIGIPFFLSLILSRKRASW